MTDLFIGVVSHEGSRFSLNQGPEGVPASLAKELAALGVACSLEVNTRNSWRPELLSIDSDAARLSARASLAFEDRWTRYLHSAGGMSGFTYLRKRVELSLRRLRQTLRPAAEPSAVRRLVNIELSHVHLWKQALKSGAAWTLILEDDARCSDLVDTAQLLASIVARTRGPAFVNLSESFDAKELGIEGLLDAVATTWPGPPERIIFALREPVTNTVCAVLYRTRFIASLIETFEQMPMTPVVPIDFKLNEALLILRAQGRFGDEPEQLGRCWQVEPAPFAQMSMRTVRESSS